MNMTQQIDVTQIKTTNAWTAAQVLSKENWRVDNWSGGGTWGNIVFVSDPIASVNWSEIHSYTHNLNVTQADIEAGRYRVSHSYRWTLASAGDNAFPNTWSEQTHFWNAADPGPGETNWQWNTIKIMTKNTWTDYRVIIEDLWSQTGWLGSWAGQTIFISTAKNVIGGIEEEVIHNLNVTESDVEQGRYKVMFQFGYNNGWTNMEWIYDEVLTAVSQKYSVRNYFDAVTPVPWFATILWTENTLRYNSYGGWNTYDNVRVHILDTRVTNVKGWLETVSHDATLMGDWTPGDPLSVIGGGWWTWWYISSITQVTKNSQTSNTWTWEIIWTIPTWAYSLLIYIRTDFTANDDEIVWYWPIYLDWNGVEELKVGWHNSTWQWNIYVRVYKDGTSIKMDRRLDWDSIPVQYLYVDWDFRNVSAWPQGPAWDGGVMLSDTMTFTLNASTPDSSIVIPHTLWVIPKSIQFVTWFPTANFPQWGSFGSYAIWENSCWYNPVATTGLFIASNRCIYSSQAWGATYQAYVSAVTATDFTITRERNNGPSWTLYVQATLVWGWVGTDWLISDAAYGPTRNGDTNAPSKNSIYDKIESMSGGWSVSIWNTTRSTQASWIETIPHWLWRTPKKVSFNFTRDNASYTETTTGHWVYNWTTQLCFWLNAANPARMQMYSDRVIMNDIANSGQRATCTFDDTNIYLNRTLTWAWMATDVIREAE
jgi:hypothetical protein